MPLCFFGGSMKRTEQREQAFILLFEKQFFTEKTCNELIDAFNETSEQKASKYAQEVFCKTCENTEVIDGYISEFAKGWKINRLPKVNLAILRLAICEMLYVDEVPDNIAINEAVELAKKYSGKEDSSFINGILGSVSRKEK